MHLKFLFIPLFILLSSCSTLNPFEENKFFYKSGYQRVQLDSEDNQIKNIHPVKIDPNSIEGALKLVITTFGGKPQALFPDDRVFTYAKAISEALLEAEPNEDVVFTLEGWYKQKGLSANKVTSGRVFYNRSGLHLIFGSILRQGNISETDPMLSNALNPDLIKNPYAPGSRFQTINNKYRLSALPNSGVFRPNVAKNRKKTIFGVKIKQSKISTQFCSRPEKKIFRKKSLGPKKRRQAIFLDDFFVEPQISSGI